MVEITDILPSLLEYCDIPVKEGIQGESMLELMAGNHSNWKNSAFAELWDVMLVDGDYKLMTYSLIKEDRGDWKLFNLKKDPNEINDLSKEPCYKEKMKSMKFKINKITSQNPPPPEY